MNVTLCSAFRSSASYLGRYFAQVRVLRDALEARGDRLHLILGEGDHVDDTREFLPVLAYRYGADIVSFDHGGPDHGSVVNAERFANMAKVWNRIWQRIPTHADAVMFVEADLVWDVETMLALLDRLADYPAIGPIILLQRHGWPLDAHYDSWATRKDGKHIGLTPPYFPGWDMQQPIQVDSTGSCLLMRGDIARQVTWPSEDVVVGVCRGIYEHGGSVWLDPKAKVVHE